MRTPSPDVAILTETHSWSMCARELSIAGFSFVRSVAGDCSASPARSWTFLLAPVRCVLVRVSDPLADCAAHAIQGSGSTAVVYCGTWRGRTVAVKRQRVADPARVSSGREHADVMKEIMISACLPHHPNVVEFHGACLDVHDRSLVNSVYEFVGGSSVEQIYDLMNSGSNSTLLPPLDLALSWCIQMVEGLACLHGCSPAVIHRDIKPSNLLITADLQTLKICDFGLCTLQERSSKGDIISPQQRMTGGTGSYRYMAPEVLLDSGYYDTSIDVFSAASCIYLMTTGKTVMSDIEDPCMVAEAVSRNVRQPLDLLVDRPALAATIAAAWDAQPSQRPTAPELAALLRQHRALVLQPARPRRGNAILRAISAVRDSIEANLQKSRSAASYTQKLLGRASRHSPKPHPSTTVTVCAGCEPCREAKGPNYDDGFGAATRGLRMVGFAATGRRDGGEKGVS